jgi:hypothetical protein
MPTLTIEYQDDAERLALEQAIAFFSQMRQVAQTAPAGTVLAACEKVALQEGRALLRKSLASAIQTRVDDAEKKGGRTPRRLRMRPRRPVQRATMSEGPDGRRAD